MVTTNTTKLMTVEEFETLPDDGWRYELIEGVRRRMPPGGLEHGGIGAEFVRRLGNFVRERDLGLVVNAESAFLFERGPDVARVPDAAFVRADRLPPREEWWRVSRVVPDLAVEVVSPNDRPQEIAEKVDLYLTHGVPLVWVAYPRSRQVVVHRPGQEPLILGEGDTLDGGDVLPGFQLPVAELFR